MINYQTMLNNGETLPIIGMGTYSGENDREITETAIRTAIKVSYVSTFQIESSAITLYRNLLCMKLV